MKINWNFLGGAGGGGGGGCKTKSLLWGEYGYFLELHNVVTHAPIAWARTDIPPK